MGAHKASSCSGVKRERDAITRPPNAAAFTAAHPLFPPIRIGTVTTAASAAASSAGLALPSIVAFDRALAACSSTFQGRASAVHWLAPRRPTAVMYRETMAPSARGLVTGIADANGA